jgi:glycosyltransferase involved in cell wall biosynthesis
MPFIASSSAQPLVSIVTPVYNGAEYLSECIESVLAQTYPHWDLTIVDNCSTDETAEIALRYAAQDSRIRIHNNQDFLPVIANHNAAFRQISPESKYCKVVFADDRISPECIERMVANAEEFPSVGLVGAYVLQGTEVVCTGLPTETRMISGHEICRRTFLDQLYVFGSANAVLYRTDLIKSRDPFYNEKNIHGDTEACFTVLRSSDFGFVHQVLTFTRVRPESLTTVSQDFRTDLAGMLQLLLVHGPEFLTRKELDALLRGHISDYYEYLGKCFLLGRGEILNFHKKKLMEAGVGFSWLRVAGGLFKAIWGLALHPKSTTQKILRTAFNVAPSDHKRSPVSGTASGVR